LGSAAPNRPTAGLILRAIAFGAGGATVGAIIYFAVLQATGYEIALVAIATGYIVGRAVQMGTQGHRGAATQIVAVALTYVSIAVGMSAGVFKEVAHSTHPAKHAVIASASATAADSSQNAAPDSGAARTAGERPQVIKTFAALIGLSLIIPLLSTLGDLPVSLLTGIIIAVGLRQAWMMNRAPPAPVFHGPFRVAAAPNSPTK
jgi:hypothetical protein